MNEEELARVLRRDPNINVPRPIHKRPLMTQPLNWKEPSRHYLASRFPAEPRTEPRQWLTANQLKTPWRELPPRRRLNESIRPPAPPAPAGTRDNEKELLPLEKERGQSETPEARKRDRSVDEEEKEEEDDDDDESIAAKKQKIDSKIGRKLDRGKGRDKPQALKATRPPARAPGILPLSPQDVRAPRAANSETGPLRNRFPGPGNFEHRWKNDPKADENRKIRDGIPRNFNDVPEVRLMPERISKNKKRVKDFKYMGDQEFYDMDIPNSGDCFFGAVSMALYGTAIYWYWVKFCHLHFFRFVLTHPGHPRYDSYWRLNSNISSRREKNIWQQLSTPHAWQSSDLLNVTADIFNLFIVLYEQLDIPNDVPKSEQKPQDHQSIGLYGQYSATHIFLHIINRNHYQTLVPYKNPEAQFPFPDGIIINPKPGRARERPPGGHGRAIIPPPIAQPVFVGPWDLDITRVLGINTNDGALDIDLVNTWMRRERQAAERKNDPTEVKWWIEAKEGEAKEVLAREASAVQWLSKGAEMKDAQPSNEALARNLEKNLGKGVEKEVQSLNEEVQKDVEMTLRKWKGNGEKFFFEDFAKNLGKTLSKWKGKGVQLSFGHFVKGLERALDKEKSVKPAIEELAKCSKDMIDKWKGKGVQLSYEDFAKGLNETLDERKSQKPSNEQLAKGLEKSFPRAPATRNPTIKKGASSMVDLLSSSSSSSDEEIEEIKHKNPSNPAAKTSTSTVPSQKDSGRSETPYIDLLSSSDEEVEEVKSGKTSKVPGKSSIATKGVVSKQGQSKAVDLLSGLDEDVVEVKQEDTPRPARPAPAAKTGGRPPHRW